MFVVHTQETNSLRDMELHSALSKFLDIFYPILIHLYLIDKNE